MDLSTWSFDYYPFYFIILYWIEKEIFKFAYFIQRGKKRDKKEETLDRCKAKIFNNDKWCENLKESFHFKKRKFK